MWISSRFPLLFYHHSFCHHVCHIIWMTFSPEDPGTFVDGQNLVSSYAFYRVVHSFYWLKLCLLPIQFLIFCPKLVGWTFMRVNTYSLEHQNTMYVLPFLFSTFLTPPPPPQTEVTNSNDRGLTCVSVSSKNHSFGYNWSLFLCELILQFNWVRTNKGRDGGGTCKYGHCDVTEREDSWAKGKTN